MIQPILPLAVWLLFSVFPVAAFSEEEESPAQPLAVVALLSDSGDQDLLDLAGQIQMVLANSTGQEVLPSSEVVRRLASGGPAGPAREDLARLDGLFQKGYLHSYSFEYRRSLATLERVLVGLRRLQPSQARWRLWVKTRIFQGLSHAGLKDEASALRSFAVVLRTRPELLLSRKEYSPRTIALWEKARKRLAGVPRGQLVVESDPAEAKVFLDGVSIGETPFIGRYPQGRYHLQVTHRDSGGAIRWVEIGAAPARVRLQLSFEGALVLDRQHPGVLLPPGSSNLPDHWWPWLSARLGVRRLVVVRREIEGEHHRVGAALVDLRLGRNLREGWLDRQNGESGERSQDAADLAEFVVTGRAAVGLRIVPVPVFDERAVAAGAEVPELPVVLAPRSWYRTWWTYAAAGGCLVGLGVGAHLAADYHERQAAAAVTVSRVSAHKDKADTWLGVAIGGYALGGAAVVAGIVLHLTYSPVEVFPESIPSAVVTGDGVGLVWSGRF